MSVNVIRDGKVRVKLSPATADLVERYAELSPEGVVTKYQIINEEIVAALHTAIERFKGEMLLGERESEYWQAQSPCVGCAEAKKCTITCRLKHNFEKEVYGGLLCGTKPAIYIYDTADVPEVMSANEYAEWRARPLDGRDKTEVFFKVRFADGGVLEIGRNVGWRSGAVWHTKFHPLVIDHREVSLRPWSMALYRTFLNRPEGITLSSLYGDNKRDLLRHYERASCSPTKTAKLKELLREGDGVQHLINNKISELNNELRAQGVAEIFMVRSEHYKANNKPYRIRYLREQQK